MKGRGIGGRRGRLIGINPPKQAEVGRGPRVARRRGILRALSRAVLPPEPVVIEGVKYRPRFRGSLERALARGRASYVVRFRGGEEMRIALTGPGHGAAASRRFADLMPDPRLEIARRLEPDVGPGMRIIELGCGTGASAAHLASIVGNSGGVIGVDRDRASVRFARRRHTAETVRGHLAFEHAEQRAREASSIDRPPTLTPVLGPIEWEPDAAFDAVVLHAAAWGWPGTVPGAGGDAAAASLEQEADEIAELVRVLARPGLLVISGDDRAAEDLGPEGRVRDLVEKVAGRRAGTRGVGVRTGTELRQAEARSRILSRGVGPVCDGWRALVLSIGGRRSLRGPVPRRGR